MASYRNVIYNFSFPRPRTLEDGLVWEDVSSVRESRLYCSEEAEKELKQHIAKYVVSGIHFIDSGDYHYMTKLITDQIREPFTLLLIDHHTDMQEDSLANMLSCGNWARKALEENLYLKSLVLVGPERQQMKETVDVQGKRILRVSFEDLKNGKASEKMRTVPTELPVYISIDKDVLSEEYAVTNWDQGEMSLAFLEYILKQLIFHFEVIGIDLCGEYTDEENVPLFLHAERVNLGCDRHLFEYLKTCLSVSKKKHLS